MLGLEPGPGALADTRTLGREIVPVVSVDRALAHWQIRLNVTGTLAVGLRVVLTVPVGERWFVYSLTAFPGTTDRTIDGWAIVTREGDRINLSYLATAATELVTGMLPQPICMGPGWTFEISIIGGASDGTWHIRALVVVDDWQES